MPSEKDIYNRHALEYEALVTHEDYQGNIPKAIREIITPEGLEVVDLGAGTGRLTCLLAPYARSVLALDLSMHMLRLAAYKLNRSPQTPWLAAVAEHCRLPLPDRSADLIVSGWSVSYLTVWHPEEWRSQAEAWLEEASRVLRPAGTLILFESLGSGNESPQRLPHLENFYGWLEEKHFQNRWIRTDYRFESPSEAAQTAGFFFGKEMEERIRREQLTILPECTGVWWMKMYSRPRLSENIGHGLGG